MTPTRYLSLATHARSDGKTWIIRGQEGTNTNLKILLEDMYSGNKLWRRLSDIELLTTKSTQR